MTHEKHTHAAPAEAAQASTPPAWYGRPVEDLGLDARINESLKGGGLNTVGDVLKLKQERGTITDVKGIGEATEKAIAEAVDKMAAGSDDAGKSNATPMADADAIRAEEEVAKAQSQATALAEAQQQAVAQNQIIAQLQRQQAEMQRGIAELDRRLAASQREAGVVAEKAPVRLSGPANVVAEQQHRDAFWPADADRVLKPIKVRTYSVNPVGASVAAGLPRAIVDRCYDQCDAKAAYFAPLNVDQHVLPVQITQIAEEIVGEATPAMAAAAAT